MIITKKRNIGTISFDEKKGWNGILSEFGFKPRGLFDPVIWRDVKWAMVRALRIMGIRKCKAKNRVSVALLIENPPQSHSTADVPTYGIAESRFVITVAPQKDICPQGRTYPKNAVAIKISRMAIPEIHVFENLKELINNPRLIWMKIKIKKNLAVFIWINRSSYP